MRILIVTDAWTPQINGVVRSLQSVAAELVRQGHSVEMLAPDRFASLPCPTYPEIRLALTTRRRIGARIGRIAPDAIHIATEGPLGLAARRHCLDRRLAFTTAYHTQFPEYLARRTRLPAGWFWRYIRWFHGPSSGILVSTATVARQLRDHGLDQSRPWGRGVDLGCFRPGLAAHPLIEALPGPILLYVGRIAVEKNIQAFLGAPIAGSKVVVGDGPERAELQRKYPDAHFLGALQGEMLARAYGGADVLVFPSRTDTFGLVMIEALACGTPVAAYPVPGPADILDRSVSGMDEDLGRAVAMALERDRAACAAYAARFSWQESARQFLAGLVPVQTQRKAAA